MKLRRRPRSHDAGLTAGELRGRADQLVALSAEEGPDNVLAVLRPSARNSTTSPSGPRRVIEPDFDDARPKLFWA